MRKMLLSSQAALSTSMILAAALWCADAGAPGQHNSRTVHQTDVASVAADYILSQKQQQQHLTKKKTRPPTISKKRTPLDESSDGETDEFLPFTSITADSSDNEENSFVLPTTFGCSDDDLDFAVESSPLLPRKNIPTINKKKRRRKKKGKKRTLHKTDDDEDGMSKNNAQENTRTKKCP